MNKKSIDINALKDYFYYKDGGLYSKLNNKQYGTKRTDGYVVFQHNKIKYYVHRVIWALHNGTIPDEKQIDHINRNKSDNTIENLRVVNVRENGLNREFKKSNTGIKGVSKDRDYYKVSFTINNKSIHVGNFKNLIDAKNCANNFLMNK
jgi:hypothetical protein